MVEGVSGTFVLAMLIDGMTVLNASSLASRLAISRLVSSVIYTN